MISCDYCSLYWHLDCLNPPLASPPNPTKKWRCPTHIEHIIVSFVPLIDEKACYLIRSAKQKPPREQANPTNITTNNENKIPSSAYRYHIGTIIEKELDELDDNNASSSTSKTDKQQQHDINSKTATPTPTPTPTPIAAENIITSKSGVMYRLPVNAIQLDFTGYVVKR